jgi:hypothetical protein
LLYNGGIPFSVDGSRDVNKTSNIKAKAKVEATDININEAFNAIVK